MHERELEDSGFLACLYTIVFSLLLLLHSFPLTPACILQFPLLSPLAPAPSMILLQDYIPQLSDKWAELGTALGLEHQVLALRESTQSPSTRANSLLSAWISAGDKVVSGVKVEVSWAFLVRVLSSPAVDKGSIASEIQAKYEI